MEIFPQRLGHKTPTWVRAGALFHVRIRAQRLQTPVLTEPCLAALLLRAAQRYQELGHWQCELFLLMPDHLHALLRFPSDPGVAKVVGSWKQGTARFQHVQWQENFFDHRIRSHQEVLQKWHYIRMNPVVKGLCREPAEWPHWWRGTTSSEAR